FTHYSDVIDHELEDLMPLEIISSAFEIAKSNVEMDEEIPLKLSNEKPIGKQIDEYYGRNKIKASLKSEIEEGFKANLEEKINDLLEEINKETTIANRLNLFKNKFPLYYTFITSLLSRFDIEIEA